MCVLLNELGKKLRRPELQYIELTEKVLLRIALHWERARKVLVSFVLHFMLRFEATASHVSLEFR